MRHFFANSSNASLYTLFPWMKTAAPQFSGWSVVLEAANGVISFVKEAIDEHVDDSKDRVDDDLIDMFLERIKNEGQSESSFYGTRGFHNLESTLFDLLLAGVDTVTHALNWAILLMMTHSDAQEKVHRELDKITGHVSLKDRDKLPYVEAVLSEVQRFGSVAPLGIPRMASKDAAIGGYVVPEGTAAFFNYFAVSRDPKYFDEPDLFSPERFLDADGGFKASKANIQFGLGKRDCLGQTLATAELFIFFTLLFKNFSFRTEHENVDREALLKPVLGLTRGPTPYMTRVIKR